MSAHDRSMLVVGHDSSLRETYALLFKGEGYPTLSGELQDLPSTLKERLFHAVILDHTLSEEERRSGVLITRQLAPEARTVVLHASGKDCGADLTMDSREGAERILDAVKNLMDDESPQSLKR